MTLIPMRGEHISEIAQLEKLCFTCPWSRNMLAAELENRCARYTVAEENGRVLGYMGMYVVEDQGFVSNLAVDPGARRRGIASALLSEQIEYAKRNAMTELMLEVRASNADAIRLYERFGFIRSGLRPRYYERPAEDAVLMNLNLGRPEE